MQVKHIVSLVISDDSEGKDVLFEQDAELAEVAITGMTKLTSGRFSVAVSSTESLSFGDVGDVRAVYVKADGDFLARFNGFTDGLPIRRASSATGATAKIFLEIDATALTIQNEDADEVLTGIFCVYGDPAA